MNNKGVSVVIAAAGAGARMNAGVNKQFLKIGGVPILVHTLKVFEEWEKTSEVIIAAKEEEISDIEKMIKDSGIKKVKKVICGGKTRQASVFNGIKEAMGEYVFIHDGARPFVSKNLLNSLYEAVEKNGAAVLGIPLKDTVSLIDENGFLSASLKRESLRAMQTPQVFKTSEILKAHKAAREIGAEYTDDCSVYMAYGGKVEVIEGSEKNIKITVPEDLYIAEKFISVE